ncbi:MAG: MFS transporter [Candidatus Hodarchaeales archaeon]|jgi:DHA1 family quinolone resistance protein-like MFS transporter
MYIQFLSTSAIISTGTFIPIFINDMGLGKDSVTIVVAVYSLLVFISTSLAGRGSDRFGRRIFLQFGLILSCLTFGVQFLANDFYTIFIIRILAGFSAGIFPPALIAYAYEQRSKMGKFSGIGSLGWAIGNLTAGFIAMYSTGYVFIMSSIFFFVAFLVALKLPKIEEFTKIIKNPNYTPSIVIIRKNSPIYVALFFRHSAAHALWTLWPLFLMNELLFNNFQIGVVQATNAITQFIVMFLITDKINADKLFPVGLLFTCSTFITFLLTTNFYLFLLTQVFLGTSWACAYVGAVKYVTENNSTYDRGTASGFLTSTLSVSGLVGPIFVFLFLLLLNEDIIYSVLILNGALMSLLALFSYSILIKMRSRNIFD